MPDEPPPRALGDSRRGALHSAEDFADLLGHKPPAKLEMQLIGDVLYTRQADGSWWEHPPYPDLP